MDCRRLQDLLYDYLAGRLDGDLRDEARGHMAGCGDCREWVELLDGEWARMVPTPPPELVDSILERTCGSPCESARDRLCAYLDGELAETEAQLVQLHVEECDDCDGLLAALNCLEEELPRLADVSPGDGFVAEVLAATVPASRRLRRRFGRLIAGIASLTSRPRFALEGAYVGMALLLLVFGFPGSPLAGVPRQVLSLTQTNPLEQLAPPTQRIRDEIAGVWTASRHQLAGSSRDLAFDARKRADRSAGTASEALKRLGLGLKRWWQDDPRPPEPGPAPETESESNDSEIRC